MKNNYAISLYLKLERKQWRKGDDLFINMYFQWTLMWTRKQLDNFIN